MSSFNGGFAVVCSWACRLTEANGFCSGGAASPGVEVGGVELGDVAMRSFAGAKGTAGAMLAGATDGTTIAVRSRRQGHARQTPTPKTENAAISLGVRGTTANRHSRERANDEPPGDYRSVPPLPLPSALRASGN